MTPIYQNDLITLAFNDGRFIILDSDKKYIDYLFDVGNVDNPLSEAQLYVHMFSDQTVCQNDLNTINTLMYCTTDINKIYQLDTKQQTTKSALQTLYDEFGEEFVCRIGDKALIMKE